MAYVYNKSIREDDRGWGGVGGAVVVIVVEGVVVVVE